MADSHQQGPSARLEIERRYLLRSLPALPAGASELRIEQGYLPVEGRLRRTTKPDGCVVCHLTIKRGEGLVREEREREISHEEFERRWPDTRGRRLVKTRFHVGMKGATWEIDRFDAAAGLVIAEIELEHPDATVAIPNWLSPVLIREVTDEPWYTNRAIALRLAAGHDGKIPVPDRFTKDSAA